MAGMSSKAQQGSDEDTADYHSGFRNAGISALAAWLAGEVAKPAELPTAAEAAVQYETSDPELAYILKDMSARLEPGYIEASGAGTAGAAETPSNGETQIPSAVTNAGGKLANTLAKPVMKLAAEKAYPLNNGYANEASSYSGPEPSYSSSLDPEIGGLTDRQRLLLQLEQPIRAQMARGSADLGINPRTKSYSGYVKKLGGM
jgi:hypothetical protein